MVRNATSPKATTTTATIAREFGVGCTMPGFPDKFMPFIIRHRGRCFLPALWPRTDVRSTPTTKVPESRDCSVEFDQKAADANIQAVRRGMPVT
jgi:hypothetical protein